MKLFQKISVFFILLFIVSIEAFSQDLLFRSDKSIQSVIIKDLNSKTVSYLLPGDSAGRVHLISKAALDSVRYSDGRTLNFKDVSGINEVPLRKVPANYISVETVNLISGNLNIDYERISRTGRRGFVAGLLINTNSRDFYYWTDYSGKLYYNYDPHYFFVRVGVNFYPFNHSLARTSSIRTLTGFSIFGGSYRQVDYREYIYSGGNYYYPTHPVFASSLMWNIKERLFLGDHFQVTGGVELSLLPFFTFLCPQISLSLGF